MTIFGRSKKQNQKANVQKHPVQPHTHQRPLTADACLDNNQAFSQVRPQPWLDDNYVSRPRTQGNGNLALNPVSSLAPYHAYSQVTVSQTYLIPSPQLKTKKSRLQKFGVNSVADLLHADIPSCVPGAQIFNEGLPLHLVGIKQNSSEIPLCDVIASKLHEVLSLIDEERFSGKEEDLMISHPTEEVSNQAPPPEKGSKHVKGSSKHPTTEKVTNRLAPTNYFVKVNLYANSRLPLDLPPLKLYIPEYRLLCLAAQYSRSVYDRPTGPERETHIPGDWRHGTKAMVIKSVPVDDKDTLIFAIRGSQGWADWLVNLDHTPTSPTGFLDDEGNLCHSGFLSVARKMIHPVASRLQKFLREDSSRKHCSLLLTGHSAGGAVATLLYSHMLSRSEHIDSELKTLAACFKRIHCITFGVPPVSLLPLRTPPSKSRHSSLFLSFINEGDLVARADKSYIRSLIDLYTTPPPGQTCLESVTPSRLRPWITGPNNYSETALLPAHAAKSRPSRAKSRSTNTVPTMAPVWRVPQATLSNAGKLVVLRSVEGWQDKAERKKRNKEKTHEKVVAQVVTDAQLRGIVFGDPSSHLMELYESRIEALASAAITGHG